VHLGQLVQQPALELGPRQRRVVARDLLADRLAQRGEVGEAERLGETVVDGDRLQRTQLRLGEVLLCAFSPNS
jgi:hypothetical protein